MTTIQLHKDGALVWTAHVWPQEQEDLLAEFILSPGHEYQLFKSGKQEMLLTPMDDMHLSVYRYAVNYRRLVRT